MNLLYEIDRSLPLVQLAVSVMRGASTDPPGKEGLTRLLVRLMRRTASGRAAEELDEHLDSIGASLGVDVGCSSCGFAGSTIARSLDAYIDVVAGVVAEPGLDAEELSRLKRETHDEILETRDNDRALARMWFRAGLFGDHPYGRNVVGTRATLSAIGHDDVVEHHKRLLLADELLVALAGDTEPARAARIADQVRRGLPSGSSALPAGRSAEAPPSPSWRSGRHLLFVDKPERTQTQVLIGGAGTHPSDEDHTALLVANTVFGGTFTARLTQEVRAKRGWSYGAYSSLPYDRQRQAFSMWTFPSATDAAACIQLQLRMLEEWVQAGISAEELEWAKNYLVRSNVFNMDTAAKRMGLLLDERIYGLPETYYAEYPERVRAVTLDAANRALTRRISTENLLVTVVGTAADVGEAIADGIDRLQVRATVAYDDDPHSPFV